MATLTSPILQSLISDVRETLGQQNATNSNWSDKEIGRYLNEAVRRYFTEVVQYNAGQFETSTNLNITSGSRTVALPTDFFSLVRLYKISGTDLILLKYNTAFDESITTTPQGSSTAFTPSYRIQGQNILLNVVPGFTETSSLKLEYIQFPTTMVDGGDSLTSEVSPVFKDLIQAYTVWKCLLALSLRGHGIDVSSAYKQTLDDLYTTFKDIISRRSAYPAVVKPYNPEDW